MHLLTESDTTSYITDKWYRCFKYLHKGLPQYNQVIIRVVLHALNLNCPFEAPSNDQKHEYEKESLAIIEEGYESMEQIVYKQMLYLKNKHNKLFRHLLRKCESIVG